MSDTTLELAEKAMNRLLDEREASGLLTTKEAANYLLSTENSLRCMRSKGYGPPFHKLGGTVIYKRDELDAYEANLRPSSIARRRSPKKERGAPGSTRMRP